MKKAGSKKSIEPKIKKHLPELNMTKERWITRYKDEESKKAHLKVGEEFQDEFV